MIHLWICSILVSMTILFLQNHPTWRIAMHQQELTVTLMVNNTDKNLRKISDSHHTGMLVLYTSYTIINSFILTLSITSFNYLLLLLLLFYHLFLFSGGARFCQLFDGIDQKVQDLCVGKPIQYRTHVGCGYFVSITTGCEFVDIRKFHLVECEMQEEPSDGGIQLRLPEWDKISWKIEHAKAVFHSLKLQAKTCIDMNHRTDALQCSECSPFCSVSSHMEHSLVDILQNTTMSDSA